MFLCHDLGELGVTPVSLAFRALRFARIVRSGLPDRELGGLH